VLKDSNGIPAPRFSYRLSENSRRMPDHAVERGSEIRRGSATGGKPPFADSRASGKGAPKPAVRLSWVERVKPIQGCRYEDAQEPGQGPDTAW
jgi:hypothetical protein